MNWGRSPILACGPILLLSACGNGSTSPSPQQNRQLANADALLDAAPDSLSNIDENALGQAENVSANADQ